MKFSSSVKLVAILCFHLAYGMDPKKTDTNAHFSDTDDSKNLIFAAHFLEGNASFRNAQLAISFEYYQWAKEHIPLISNTPTETIAPADNSNDRDEASAEDTPLS